MYGHIAELTLSAIPNGTVVGDFILIPTNGNSFPATGAEDSVIGPIILAEGQIASIDTVNKKLTVLTTWKYNETKKYFEYPNAAFKPASNYTVINPGGWISSNVRGTINGTVVTGVAITHFLSPDLSSRFIVGSLGTGFAGQPENATFSKASFEEDNSRIKTYEQGAFGGEESHILTTAEMPAHSHNLKVLQNAVGTGSLNIIGPDNHNTNFSGTVNTILTGSDGQPPRTAATGSNTAHNNMPPYLAVRYIIKAKPYTRAAIIDGIDLPYTSLLVRDLRSRNVGGSNGDLVFHTNTSGDSGNGTERMRLTTDGKLVVGYSSAVTSPNPLLVFGPQFSANYPVNAMLMDTDNPAVGKGGGIAFAGKPSTASDPASISGRALFASIGGYKENSTDGDYAGYLSLNTRNSLGVSSVERVRITSTGDVGIRTTTPGATLDVNGTLRVGDFGGATNVMPKPSGAVSGTAVGKVVPLFHYYGNDPTTFLSAGTWFVCFNAQMNGPGAPDENNVATAAFTVTVPSGQYFGLATAYGATLRNTSASGHKGSGIIGRFFTDTTAQSTGIAISSYPTIPSGWTEFSEDGTAPFISKSYYTGVTVPPATDSHSMIHIRGDGSSIGYAALIHGYAIRIA